MTPTDPTTAQPTTKPLYYGTLIERLVTHAKAKRKYDETRYVRSKRFSWANLARLTGIPLDTVHNYFIKRNCIIPVAALDKVLWAMGLSVLDLIEPSEFASYVESMPSGERRRVRAALKLALDREADSGDTQSTPVESGSQQ